MTEPMHWHKSYGMVGCLPADLGTYDSLAPALADANEDVDAHNEADREHEVSRLWGEGASHCRGEHCLTVIEVYACLEDCEEEAS